MNPVKGQNLKKAVFLDRDGTIIEDTGYLGNSEDVEFFPFTFESLLSLQHDFLLFIVSNQSGISKGIVSKDQVERVNEYILSSLKEKGINICELFYCPHKTEDHCVCKKPAPYFLKLAAEKYNIDLSQSWMLGDHPSDVLCADAAGVKGIYLLTGHGSKHQTELNNEYIVFSDLKKATHFILNQNVE